MNQKWFPGLPWERVSQLNGMLDTSEEYTSQAALIKPKNSGSESPGTHFVLRVSVTSCFQSLFTVPCF